MLLIDTSTRIGRTGLTRGGAVVNECRLDPERGHARDLTRAIRDVLASVALPITAIDAIAVNVGPGSLTGIRVGLATAKAIAYATGIRMIGVDVFDLIAQRHNRLASDFRGVVDFQLNATLCVDYRRSVDDRHERGPLQIVPAPEMKALVDEGWPFAGPGVAKLLRIHPHAARVDDTPWESSLADLATIAWERFCAGQFSDHFAIEPFYARASSAEEIWDARPKTELSERSE